MLVEFSVVCPCEGGNNSEMDELNFEECQQFPNKSSTTRKNSTAKFVHKKARESIEGKAGIADENISRALRSVKTDDMRKTSRHTRLSLLRGIENLPKPIRSIEVNKETTKNVIRKPSAREEQLKKWKEEKMLKKQLELKAKRPPFVVSRRMQESQPAVSFSDSHIKKDSFVSKIPRAFTGKLPRIPEVSSQLKTSSGKPVSKFGLTCKSAEKTILGESNGKRNQPVVKNWINHAVYKNTAKSHFSQTNSASAKPISENQKVKPSVTKNAYSFKLDHSVTNKAVKPKVCKDVSVATPVSRPSFAPPNFVFTPSAFGNICERFEEAAKALQTSTPIKTGRKSERGLSFQSGKFNPLTKKSGILSVHSSSSNLGDVVESTVSSSSNSNPDKINQHNGSDFPSAPQSQKLSKIVEICTNENSAVLDSEEETKENDLDVMNEQSLHTPRRSMRLQHKSNEDVLQSNQSSVADNFKKDSDANSHQAENGVFLETPRRSMRLQFKDIGKEHSADDTSVFYSPKDVQADKPKIETGITKRTPRRSRRLQSKTDETEHDANKVPLVNSGKGNKSRKSQAENLMAFYTPHCSNTLEYSTICEENELSLVENSPVVDLKATPVSTSQKTRLTDDFEKLSLQSFLDNIPEKKEQNPVFEPKRDFRPSLLYTPINKAKKSIIHVTGDMIVFSPDS